MLINTAVVLVACNQFKKYHRTAGRYRIFVPFVRSAACYTQQGERKNNRSYVLRRLFLHGRSIFPISGSPWTVSFQIYRDDHLQLLCGLCLYPVYRQESWSKQVWQKRFSMIALRCCFWQWVEWLRWETEPFFPLSVCWWQKHDNTGSALCNLRTWRKTI